MGYGYLVGALLVMVAIAGAGWRGYTLGGDSVRAAYADRDLKAASENAAKFQALSNEYREKEKKLANASAVVSKKYQKELDANATYYLTLLATAPVLRDPGTASSKTCGDSTAAVAASAGRHNDETGAGLSKEATTFLLSEASRADAYTAQLGACQDLLESERK